MTEPELKQLLTAITPPSGLARLAQWACAAARAVSLGGVMAVRSCFSSGSVMGSAPSGD